MAPRANWKGHLKLALVSCPVALYTAASTSDRISFHTLNRATGHRVRRQYIDEETEETVEREDQVKGYERSDREVVTLEEEEVKAAVPESSKLLEIEAFIPEAGMDEVYLDRPYYLAPADGAAEEAFAVIRAAMAAKKVVGIARTVLFRRERALLLTPGERGILASTLHYDYEIRDAKEVFDQVPKLKLEKELLDLAKHIIQTKRGRFDPSAFEDRYEAALLELIKAKKAGKPLPKPAAAPDRGKVVNLLDALRKSAAAGGKPPRKAAALKASGGKSTRRKQPTKAKRKTAQRMRKAG